MFKQENKAGLYLTIAVHLLLLIVLLATKIDFILKEESSFILDFTKEELQERVAYLERVKEEAKLEVDRLLNEGQPIRNVAVDATKQKGERLADDRFKDPSEVYRQAEDLKNKLKQSKMDAQRGDVAVGERGSRSDKKSERQKSYKGPSVISYKVEGRSAITLPVPAYKCLGGGDVVVEVKVDRAGFVKEATVVAARSSSDQCLQSYSLLAAKSSRFTSKPSDVPLKVGEITYRFISQKGG